VAECRVLLDETPEADSIDYDAWSWFKITPHFVVNHPLTKSSHSTEFDFWALSYSHESSASWSDHSDVIDGDPVRINVPLRVSCRRG
jgi:hypothetical protein